MICKRHIVGFEVEREIAILSVECGGAIVVIQHSLFDRDLAGTQIEERVDCRLAVLFGPERARLIRRTVGIDDEVQLGPDNLQVAQGNMRSEEAEDAHLDAQAVDLGVGSFAGILSAMNDDPVGLSFEMKKTPMKRRNLSPTAGGRFNLSDETLADQILERGGAGDEVGGNCREDEQDRGRRDRKRQMAQEESAQTCALAARRRFRRERLIGRDRSGTAVAHGLAPGLVTALASGLAPGLES